MGWDGMGGRWESGCGRKRSEQKGRGDVVFDRGDDRGGSSLEGNDGWMFLLSDGAYALSKVK